MPVAPLLQRYIDDELERSSALIERVIAGTVQLLGRTFEPHTSAPERAQQSGVSNLLQREAAAFERAFIDSLRQRVTADVEDAGDAGSGDAPGSRGGLQLMDESLVEVDIEISRAMQLIDATAEWEQRELQTFTSALIGQKHVSADSNPFRPVTYAGALWDAACAVLPTHVQRAILLRTASGVAAGLLKNAWAAATTRLESQGVHPSLYRTVVLPSGSAPAKPTAPDAKRQAPSALLSSMPGMVDPRTGQPVMSFNSAIGSARPASGEFGISLHTREFERALQELDELLMYVPATGPETDDAVAGAERDAMIQKLEQERLKVVTSAAGTQRQLVELMCRMFDSIRADAQLAAAFRPTVSRLQVPTLRLALRDPSLMESFEHPAWVLFDRIGNIGSCYPRTHDERFVSLASTCEEFANEAAGASTPDIELFRRGLNRVDALLAAQMKSQLRDARDTIAALELSERRELVELHMSRKLTDQLASIRTSPEVRRFITGAWAKVIATNAITHGEQSEAVAKDMKTIDDLLWSVNIPDHRQSRQRLVGLLPTLLARLRAGMDLIKLPDAEKHAILNALVLLHAAGLRSGGTRAAAGALTPDEIVQRMRDEVIPEPGRHFSDSVIDLSSMDTVPADAFPSESGGDEVNSKRVDELRAGQRQRLFINGRWNQVQLLWRSDRGMFFLFAGETPSRTHSITRRALERLNTAGLLQPNEVKSLVQRAGDRVLRHLPQAA